MLVLSRRPGQSILIGKDIEVVVLGSDGVQVRVGIRAPREVTVLRRELLKQVEEENRRATSGTIGASVASLGAALGQLGGQLGGDFNARPRAPQPESAAAPVAKPAAEPEKVPRAGAA
jgi:carbon storage regulator